MPLSPCNCAGVRILLGLALVVGTWLALTPQPMPMPEVPQIDKWVHMTAYLLLAILIDAGWPDREFDLPKWAFLLGYGILIELIQSQIPNRMFSLGDLAANASGIAIYAFALRGLLWRWTSH